MNSPVDAETDDIISHVYPEAEQVGDDLAQVGLETLTKLEPNIEEIESLGGDADPKKGHLQFINVFATSVDTIKSTSVVQFINKYVTTFENIIPNDALSNVEYYTTGAYLQVDLDPTENVIYIADTSKFKSSGYLLIGDETVFYYRKIGDRFLQVQRGQEGTTAQAWVAGTFLRQLPDPITSVSAAVTQVESESKLVAVSAASGTVGTGQDRQRQQQVIAPVVTLQSTSVVGVGQLQLQSTSTITEIIADHQKVYDIDEANITQSSLQHNATQVNATVQSMTSEFVTERVELTVTKAGSEFFFDLPPGGAVDGYEETAFFTDPVSTRLNGLVDLVDNQGLYSVVQRGGSEIEIVNAVFGAFAAFVGVYAKTNAGFTISHRDGIFDSGTAGVSGLTIADFDFYFPSISIRDFAERGDSSFALDGTKFILMPPSIQNPVTIATSGVDINGELDVNSTNYFPTTGYILIKLSSGIYAGTTSVFEYTGKNATTFTGVTKIRGDGFPSTGDEVIPFTID